MRFTSRIFGLLVIPVVAVVMLLTAETHPGYFSNVTYLGGLLLLEVALAAVWHYERWFFFILMLTFIWAGTNLPLAGAGSVVRWVFLAVGAFVGLVKWAEQEPRQHFTGIHLVALLCVLSAVVSAMVSNRTQMSLLKSSSFFLLFLYGSCGVRVAVAGREAGFFRRLLTACEGISYVSGFLYIVLRFELFGNPNSLGAVMGVAIVPVLFWGVLIAEDRSLRHRRAFAFLLASYLLYSSVSRAGFLACAIAITVACIALRRHKLLIQGAFAVIFMGAVIAVVQPGQFDALVSSFSEDLIYKGKPQEGLLGSRTSPWKDTVAVIRESPWFGSGFGTDVAPGEPVQASSVFRTIEGTVREHGNSYLALLEYVGLLGVVPFVILLYQTLRLVFRSCCWMWRTGDAHHYAVPLAMICVAGLVHAVFEDWLFAVGYYLNIFFWTSVFILSDLQPRPLKKAIALYNPWRHAPANPEPVPVSASQ
jgi:O-antigen ligase